MIDELTNSEESAAIRVVAVDDHDMLRQGVIAALAGFDDIEVVGDASDGVAGVELVKELDPDVVLMDLIMPSGSGILAIRDVKTYRQDTRILALTSFSDRHLVREALAAGATSYVMKNVDIQTLVDAIRTTARDHSTLAPEIARQMAVDPGEVVDGYASVLTDRETEVAELMALGRSNAEIAAELNRSLYTVKNHVSNVLMKLNARSRTEVAALIHSHRMDRKAESS